MLDLGKIEGCWGRGQGGQSSEGVSESWGLELITNQSKILQCFNRSPVALLEQGGTFEA